MMLQCIMMNRMPSSEGAITHVSDTALMLAACRAHEAELHDAFVSDPFAARLCGERGFAILRELPYADVMRIGMAIRTRFLDDLLLEALQSHPITAVLSVGSGLDTRPWRLDLDQNLRWIEVDFADILDYKDRLMQGETARCRRERLSIDLNDPTQRQLLYESAASESALMITEGLLMYLPATTVEAFAAEASNRTVIRHWISDITTSAFSRVLGAGADTTASIRHVQALDRLEGEQILETILGSGWAIASKRSYITDVGFVQERVRRMNGGATPSPMPFPPGDPTGVLRFSRA
jgi:methyltransferase (TIGR00027 family)